jgi:acyl-[acyl-carrier-protein]-phospholipid O-acyltransferase / long-chain-fatty-acid--[acyl-carrier-protein] ligase
MFAIDTHIARRWWVRPFLELVEAFPMDPTSPLATRALIREVEKGKHCVIFPEGRITVTGALMKVYEGPGMIADKADAQILPVRIDGASVQPLLAAEGQVPPALLSQDHHHRAAAAAIPDHRRTRAAAGAASWPATRSTR